MRFYLIPVLFFQHLHPTEESQLARIYHIVDFQNSPEQLKKLFINNWLNPNPATNQIKCKKQTIKDKILKRILDFVFIWTLQNQQYLEIKTKVYYKLKIELPKKETEPQGFAILINIEIERLNLNEISKFEIIITTKVISQNKEQPISIWRSHPQDFFEKEFIKTTIIPQIFQEIIHAIKWSKLAKPK